MAGKVKQPDLVARIKGAAALRIPKKAIARATGVPLTTVEAYASGARAESIQPDNGLAVLFNAFMRGEI